jgi:hypothetical protein
MAVKATWKLVVKDGDTVGKYNSAGGWSSKTIDYVEDHDNLAGALQSFLQWIDDYGGETDGKVSLVYVPAKKK